MKRNFLVCSNGQPSDYIIDTDQIDFALYDKQQNIVKVQFRSGQIQNFQYAHPQEAKKMYDCILNAFNKSEAIND